jgi:hypothetical protein
MCMEGLRPRLDTVVTTYLMYWEIRPTVNTDASKYVPMIQIHVGEW